MGALEVLRTLHDHGVETERPVVLVDWTNEEGSRFAPAMMASGVWAGALDRDWAWARTDADGLALRRRARRASATAAPSPCARRAVPRLLRAAHRAGSAPRARGRDHRRAARHRLPALVRRARRGRRPTRSARRRWRDGTTRWSPPPRWSSRSGTCRRGWAAAWSPPSASCTRTPTRATSCPAARTSRSTSASWDDELALARLGRCCRRSSAAIAARHGCGLRVEETWRVRHNEFAPELVARVRDTAARLGYSTLGHGERRRPRRELHGHRGPDGHGLRAQRRRAQPRRGGGDELGGLRGRRERPAPAACSPPRTSARRTPAPAEPSPGSL